MSIMKFQDVPMGSRFRFKGESYVKNGPMTASALQGTRQQFMKRYDEVVMEGESTPHVATEPVGRDVVKDAIDVLGREIERIINRALLDDPFTRKQILAEFEHHKTLVLSRFTSPQTSHESTAPGAIDSP